MTDRQAAEARLIPVGEHGCVTCARCACTFAAVHPACPRCSEEARASVRLAQAEPALIRCAEIAGEDGEAVEAARSGAMVQPTLAEWAVRCVEQLRRDYDESDGHWAEIGATQAARAGEAVAVFVTPGGDRSTMSEQEDERRSP